MFLCTYIGTTTWRNRIISEVRNIRRKQKKKTKRMNESRSRNGEYTQYQLEEQNNNHKLRSVIMLVIVDRGELRSLQVVPRFWEIELSRVC